MVQDFVLAAYRWLLSAASELKVLLPWIVIGIALLAILWLAIQRLDPQTGQALRARLSLRSGKWRHFVLMGFSLLVLCGALVQAKKVVGFRQMTVEEAPASRRNVPQLDGIVQYAPRIGEMKEQTYTRTLTLPPYYAQQIGTQGLQILSPYLSDPSAENVTKLVDSFKRSGRDVVFTRQVTRIDEAPLSAESAEVKVHFSHRGSASGHRYYEAIFDAQYRFRNPEPNPATLRLTFPLPQGGGTVQGFYIQAGGKRVTEPDDHGEYAWVDTVPANGMIAADVHYTVTGSRGFVYAVGSEQRRIGSFHMVAESSQLPRYAKTGIYPTSIHGQNSEWRLKDVITAQSVAMIFPTLDLDSQLLDKTLAFLPLVLILFGVGAFLLVPQKAFWGTIAFALGLMGMAVLSAYAPPNLATLAGAAIAAFAGGVALGGIRGWSLSAIAGAMTLVFLTAEHAALAAWALSLAVLFFALAARGRNLSAAA